MTDKLKERAEKVFKIKTEIQMRCGSGDGKKPTSHSVNCKCKELNQKLHEVMKGT